MITQVLDVRLSAEDKETHLWIDADGRWVMDTTIPKDWKSALKHGWTATGKTIDSSGATVGMILTAPRHAVSIKSATQKRRPMSDEQRAAAAERLAAARQQRTFDKGE